MAVPQLVAAGRYVHWGVIQISVTNLVIILVMIAVFIAALLLPFPGDSGAHGAHSTPERSDDAH